jgi:hypothetical protein
VVAGRELDAPLAAAERDVVERALVRHPRRQRLYLVEGDLFVVPDAPLVRTQDIAVLNPVALEHLVLSAVHADREVDDELVLGLRQDVADRGGQTRDGGGAIELFESDGVRVWFFEG